MLLTVLNLYIGHIINVRTFTIKFNYYFTNTFYERLWVYTGHLKTTLTYNNIEVREP